jgi:hypothetical protein
VKKMSAISSELSASCNPGLTCDGRGDSYGSNVDAFQSDQVDDLAPFRVGRSGSVVGLSLPEQASGRMDLTAHTFLWVLGVGHN